MIKTFVVLALVFGLLVSGAWAMTPEEEDAAWKKEPAYGQTIRIGYNGGLCTGTLGITHVKGFYEAEGLKTEIVRYQMANGSLLWRLSMIPAAVAFLLVIPGETGSHPFDAAEAETEICEGMLAEYSGAPLGVYKLSHAVKLLTMTSLFVMLFLGGIGGRLEALVYALGLTGGAAGALVMLLSVLVLFLLCVLLTAVAISLVHAVTARLKIEQIFKYYWTVVAALALLSLALAWYGL